MSDDFGVNESDSCVYFKSNEHSVVIIYLYVDDMLIVGTSIEVMKLTNVFWNSKFDIKDLGEANLIIRVKMKRSEFGISVNQAHMLKKFWENLITLV